MTRQLVLVQTVIRNITSLQYVYISDRKWVELKKTSRYEPLFHEKIIFSESHDTRLQQYLMINVSISDKRFRIQILLEPPYLLCCREFVLFAFSEVWVLCSIAMYYAGHFHLWLASSSQCTKVSL